VILGFAVYCIVRYKHIRSDVTHFQDLKSAKTAYEKSMSEFRTPEIKALLSEVEKQIKEEERKAYIDPVKAEEEKEKGNALFKSGL
jgi:stress-induced-phosphoprotein 1